MNDLGRLIQLAVIGLITIVSAGCISTGETIRVSGEIVGTDGQRIPGAIVIAEGTKRGGTLIGPGGLSDPEAENEPREAIVELPGDGTFVATSNWAGAVTITVEGHKIRRVDDLGTEFLVPNRSFFKSQEQVRLEVVRDE